MSLGIDFGTTRTIVAISDRGNYPVVDFYDEDDDTRSYFPSVAAEKDGEIVYGWDAVAAAERGHAALRSFKRILSSPEVTLSNSVTVGDTTVELTQFLKGFFIALHQALRYRSSLQEELETPTKAAVAVPAHSRSGQRFITLEAFRNAGFEVVAMLNEPSAAGFEYTHRQSKMINSKRTKVLVYDLGGGTFDASIVRVVATDHQVLDTVGINHLGGDDFDRVLAEMALEKLGLSFDDLTGIEANQLLEQVRDTKERISPQTKRVLIDIGDEPVTISVADYYERLSGLLDQSLEAISPLTQRFETDAQSDIAGIYLVGGASQLPLVSRVLKAKFGRRVHKAPLPAASTAIGLAIALDDEAGYSLTDQLSRGFGVFREMKAGAELSFDPIFDRSMETDSTPTITRRYRAAHNIGQFRFVEYSDLGPGCTPQGDVVPLGEIIFPFIADLNQTEVADLPIQPMRNGPLIEERYRIDNHGIVQIEIANLDAGYRRRFSLS